MSKFKWFVLSETGWAQFSCGFCWESDVADAQLLIFGMRYPERVFTYVKAP